MMVYGLILDKVGLNVIDIMMVLDCACCDEQWIDWMDG